MSAPFRPVSCERRAALAVAISLPIAWSMLGAGPISQAVPQSKLPATGTSSRSSSSSIGLKLCSPHVEISLRRIAPGTFNMGDPEHLPPTSKRRFVLRLLGAGSVSLPYDAGPVRETTITRPFYLAETKVTAKEYCSFLNQSKTPKDYIAFNRWTPIELKDGVYAPKHSCEQVAVSTIPYEGAVAYCEWLTEQFGFTFRLPTEAEWEFAARGPQTRRYPWGNKDGMDGRDIYPKRTDSEHFLTMTADNATPDGVHDMVGLFEWCSDWYTNGYLPEENVDPKGPCTGEDKVLRGRGYDPVDRGKCGLGVGAVADAGIYGFRVLMECPPAPPQPQKAAAPANDPV